MAKILIISKFACREIFRALASILRVVKINPTCHFDPPSTKGGGYFFAYLANKSYNWYICMHANFHGSRFKIENLKNLPYFQL